MAAKVGTAPLLFWPHDADLGPVREAFAGAEIPFPVKPTRFKPEMDGRVLVLEGAVFPYIHDHARAANPAQLKLALQWCLFVKEPNRGPTLVIDQLRAVFGPEVEEVFDEDEI